MENLQGNRQIPERIETSEYIKEMLIKIQYLYNMGYVLTRLDFHSKVPINWVSYIFPGHKSNVK